MIDEEKSIWEDKINEFIKSIEYQSEDRSLSLSGCVDKVDIFLKNWHADPRNKKKSKIAQLHIAGSGKDQVTLNVNTEVYTLDIAGYVHDNWEAFEERNKQLEDKGLKRKTAEEWIAEMSSFMYMQ